MGESVLKPIPNTCRRASEWGSRGSLWGGAKMCATLWLTIFLWACVLPLRADYLGALKSNGASTLRLPAGKSFELDVELRSNNNDSIDAAELRLVVSQPGLVLDRYVWAAPFPNRLPEDDSTPALASLPQPLTPDSFKLAGEVTPAIDFRLSDITDLTAITSPVFRSGQLARISFTVAESVVPGTVYEISIAQANLVNGFDTVPLATSSGFTLTVQKPPVIEKVPDAVLNEKQAFSHQIVGTAITPPIAPLVYAKISGPEGLVISSTGLVLWTPGETDGGVEHTVVFSALDGQLAVQGTFKIKVNEVNEPPQFIPIASRAVDENTLLDFNLIALDSDLPAQSLRFSKVSGPATLQVSTSGRVTWTPTELDGGSSFQVVVAVDDGIVSTTATWNLMVNESNATPQFTLPTSVVLEEGVPWSLQFAASDADIPTQSLLFTKVAGPAALLLSSGGLAQWTPNEADGGSVFQLQVALSDGLVQIERTIQLEVRKSNSAPLFDPIPPIQAVEGQTLQLTLAARDLDLPAQPLIYSKVSGPADLTVDAAGHVSWTPAETHGGQSFTAVVQASDGLLSATTGLTIVVQEQNSAPVMQPIPDQELDEGAVLQLALSATDADLPVQALRFSKVSGPSALSVGSSGTLVWETTEADGGARYPVTVAVSDGGASVQTTFNILVRETNQAPVTAASLNLKAAEGVLFSYQIPVQDADLPAQSLVFRKLSGPEALTVSPQGSVSWIPGELDGGTIAKVSFTVSDGSETVVGELGIAVAEVNTLPVFHAIPAQTLIVGRRFAIQLAASDADLPAQTFLFGKLSGPAALSVSFSGEVTWTPALADIGTHQLRVFASDGLDQQTQIIDLLVVPEPNTPPTLAPLSNAFGAANKSLLVPLAITDAETPVDQLDVQISVDNPGLFPKTGIALGPDRSWLSLTPSPSQSGKSTVTVVVKDPSGAAVSRSFTATIAAPVAPTLALLEPSQSVISMDEDSQTRILLRVSDADTALDRLTVTVESSNTNLLPQASLQFEPTSSAGVWSLLLAPAANQSGTAALKVSVSDGTLVSSIAIQVLVKPVNDLPVIFGLKDLTIAAGIASSAMLFRVEDVETPAADLQVELASSDPNILNTSQLKLGSNGAQRSLVAFPSIKASGSATITVTVVDAEGGHSSSQLVVRVEPSKIPPSIQLPDVWLVDEDQATTLATATRPGTSPLIVLADDTTDPASLKVSARASNTALFPEGALVVAPIPGRGQLRQLRLIPASNKSGESVITVRVQDLDGLFSEASMRVVVNPVNDPPEILPIPPQQGIESGVIGPVSLRFSDPETPSGALRLQVSSDNPVLFPESGITVDVKSSVLTLKPAAGLSGLAAVTVTVTDPEGASASTRFSVQVLPVNHPPAIRAPGALSLVSGEQRSVPLSVEDSDSDPATLDVSVGIQSAVGLDGVTPQPGLLGQLGSLVARKSSTGWFLDIKPAPNLTGKALLRLTARDALGAASTPALVTVSVTAPSQGPELTFLGVTSLKAVEGTLSSILEFDAAGMATLPGFAVKIQATDTAAIPDTAIHLSRIGNSSRYQLRVAAPSGRTGVFDLQLSASTAASGTSTYSIPLLITHAPVISLTSGLVDGTLPVVENQAGAVVRFHVEDVETAGMGLKVSVDVAPAVDGTSLINPEDFEVQMDAGDLSLRFNAPLNTTGSASARLRVLDAEGGEASFPFKILIVPASPAIRVTATPGDTVELGRPLRLQTQILAGTPPLQFQWFYNNNPIAGQTGPELSLAPLDPTAGGRYTVEARNAGGVTQAATTITVIAPAGITQQPQSQSLQLGQNLRLEVRAQTSGGVLGYQWRKGGRPILGETSNVLLRTPAQPTDAGFYDVIVRRSDSGTAILSEVAQVEVLTPTLAVSDALASAPTLPSNRSVVDGVQRLGGEGRANNLGATLQAGEPFHAGKPGGHSVWVRWLAPASGLMTLHTKGSSFDTLLAVYRSAIPTATPAPNQIETVASDDDGGDAFTSFLQFNAIVGQEYFIAIDGRAGATGVFQLAWEFVESSLPAPELLSPVADVVAQEGQAVIFSVIALNADTYTWSFNGKPLAGETRPELRIPRVDAQTVGRYEVRISNPHGTKISAASLIINSDPNTVVTDKTFDRPFLANGPTTQALSLRGREFRESSASAASGFRGTQVFNTFGSSVELGEASLCGVLGGASQWEAYVAPADGDLLISTEGSDFDTLLGLYTGPQDQGIEGLTLVACDNNSGVDGRTSRLTYRVRAGQTYYLAVDGVNGVTGVVKLSYALSLPPVAVSLPAVRPDSTGVVRFSLPTTVGARYTLQTSANLAGWRTLISTNAGSSTIEFRDPEAPSASTRFYRLLRE